MPCQAKRDGRGNSIRRVWRVEREAAISIIVRHLRGHRRHTTRHASNAISKTSCRAGGPKSRSAWASRSGIAVAIAGGRRVADPPMKSCNGATMAAKATATRTIVRPYSTCSPARRYRAPRREPRTMSSGTPRVPCAQGGRGKLGLKTMATQSIRVGDALAHLVAGGLSASSCLPTGSRMPTESCPTATVMPDRVYSHGGTRLQPNSITPKRRFEKKGNQTLMGDHRTDHIADHNRKSAPVGAELVRQYDPRRHAHGK
jgi:hypothetical protein